MDIETAKAWGSVTKGKLGRDAFNSRDQCSAYMIPQNEQIRVRIVRENDFALLLRKAKALDWLALHKWERILVPIQYRVEGEVELGFLHPTLLGAIEKAMEAQ